MASKKQEEFSGFNSSLTFPELVFGVGALLSLCAVGYLGLQYLIKLF